MTASIKFSNIQPIAKETLLGGHGQGPKGLTSRTWLQQFVDAEMNLIGGIVPGIFLPLIRPQHLQLSAGMNGNQISWIADRVGKKQQTLSPTMQTKKNASRFAWPHRKPHSGPIHQTRDGVEALDGSSPIALPMAVSIVGADVETVSERTPRRSDGQTGRVGFGV